MKRLTLKQRAFVNKTIETLNPTEAAMQVYQPKNRLTARVMASENLTNPNIRAVIDSALPSDEIENNIIHKALSTKTPKEIKWNELHSYLETSLKLKGRLKEKMDNKTQVAIIIEK